MEKRNPAKKRNFSDVEIETLTSQVQSNQLVLFGSLKSGVKGSQKNAVWREITAAVNTVGVVNRTPAEVWIFFYWTFIAYLYFVSISLQVFKKNIIVSLNFYTESIVALKYTLWLYNAFKFKQN